ncbi:MAG: hypothetical protein OWT28_02725 [Firmicutes bacterium]|nr:hypothetical protein [Bacillota bacterium]
MDTVHEGGTTEADGAFVPDRVTDRRRKRFLVCYRTTVYGKNKRLTPLFGKGGQVCKWQSRYRYD